MRNFNRSSRNNRQGGRNRQGGQSNQSSQSRFSSFGPREMHKAVCDKCKKECEVPFKPTPGKPVYCKECYRSMT